MRRLSLSPRGGTLLALVLLALASGGAVADDPASAFEAAAKRARETKDAAAGLSALQEAARAQRHLDDPHSQRSLLERLATDARSPLVRARARFAQARAMARAGELARAARLDDTAGLVREAWLLGPFENTGGTAVSQPLSVEDAPFDEARRVPGLGREVGWQRIERGYRRGAFDVDAYLEPSREVRALLAFAVISDRDRDVALRLATTGPVVAVVNGEEVAASDATRPLGFDQTAGAVRLRRGKNLVLLRVGNTEGGLEVIARLTAPDGGALRGVRASAEPQDLRAAATTKPAATKPTAIDDPVAAVRAALEDPKADRTDALWRAVHLELAMRAGEQRQRPTALERWLKELIAASEGALAAPASGAQAEDAIGRHLAEAHALLGGELVGRDPTQARMHLERALDLAPDHVDALVGLAQLRGDQGLPHEARVLFSRARALAPSSPWVEAERLAFERAHGVVRPLTDAATFALADRIPSAVHLEVAAEIASERGDAARSLSYLERLAATDVVHPALTHAKQQALEAQLAAEEGSAAALDEYIALLELRLRHFPESHHIASQLARALVGAGRKERARQLVAARKRRFHERPEPLALEAELALLEGRRDDARDALRAALALTPQDRELSELMRELAGQGDGLAERYALDTEALRNTPVPEGAREAGADLVASTLAVRFYRNGLAQMVQDRVFRVHDPKKAAGLSSLSVSYSGGREVVDVLVAERITKSGRRQAARGIADRGPGGKQGGMYTDSRAKVIVFGDLHEGDLIHVRTRRELVGQQNLFGDFFGHIEPVQTGIPVQNWRVVVEGPKDRPLAWGGRGVPDPAISERDDVRVYDFRVPSAPRIEGEPSMPPWFEGAAYLSVSTYDSWEAMGEWYAALVHPQLRLDAALKKKAHEATAGAGSVEEKVRRLYELVVESTRYVGIELGIHGWKPYPVTEVYRRRYGDCKDKASLLVALLGEVGVDARLALVRTANLGHLADGPASMWAFNHAIAYVPELDLFLDGTAERSGYRELPALDQGAMTLIVAPYGSKEKSRLATIPVSTAEDNYNESSYVLDLSPEGTLRLEGEERFRGVHNADRRGELVDPATRKEAIERTLAQILPGAAVHRVDVSKLSLSATELSYTFAATLPNRAVRAQSGALTLPLSLYPHDLTGSYARLSTREHDVWVTYPWRTRNVMRYRLPPGFAAIDLPDGGVVETPHLRFVQRITRTEDGFIVDEDTMIRSRRIPRADYEAFRRAALNADALMKRKVRIERRGGEG